MSHGDTGQTHPYVLGHSAKELDRLATQARLIDPITRQFFVEAGLAPGMRVLDVGSGAGDVAFVAAGLVGPTGEVVGVDRSGAALARAQARAEDRSLANVSFREGDPATMTFERPFDAIVGRYVLQFQSDPSAMLRSLRKHAKSGGVIAFHELDWSGVQSYPPLPLRDRCCAWTAETIRRHGTEIRMGVKLYRAFVAAGLGSPALRLQAVIGGPAEGLGIIDLEVGVAATLLPDMVRLGVATEAEVGIETLAERIKAEVTALGGVAIGRSEICAWVTV